MNTDYSELYRAMQERDAHECARKPQVGGFEPVVEIKLCRDPEHHPPQYLHVPLGFRYRHVCPSCKLQTLIGPTTVVL
jgi:hypothetical protein